MAELTPKERLQPSLLDRLTDEEPDRKQESRDKRVLSPLRLRDSVRRDLSWLFNATQLGTVEELDSFPHVQRSTLNFGIPDLAGLSLSSVDPVAVERLLRRAIWDFEPRLLRSSVKVRLIDNEDREHHNALAFTIEADLWAQPVPLRLFLRTELDLEDGTVRVSELSSLSA
jgi:type VI secretion system protein ImpF